MAKKVDITEKLEFETSPKLVIKGKEYEVNADAPTALKIMGLLDDGFSNNDVLKAYGLVFPETTQKELDSLKLSFKDFLTVVEEAIDIITGRDEEPGE